MNTFSIDYIRKNKLRKEYGNIKYQNNSKMQKHHIRKRYKGIQSILQTCI